MVGVGKFAVPLINLLIGTYTFTTGLHVEQVIFHELKKIIKSEPKRQVKYNSNLSGLWEGFLMIYLRLER